MLGFEQSLHRWTDFYGLYVKNDVFSRTEVPFGGHDETGHHFGSQNPNLWSVNRRFQALVANIKRNHYRFQPNLHSDKDHQMLLMGGPNTRITNPRWRTAAILEKSKNCHISTMVRPIATKFGYAVRLS